MGNARRSGLRPNHAPKGDGGGDGDDDDKHGDDEQHASDDDGGHCVMLSSVLFSRRRWRAHQAHSGNQRLRAVLRGALDKPKRVCNGGQLRQDIEPRQRYVSRRCTAQLPELLEDDELFSEEREVEESLSDWEDDDGLECVALEVAQSLSVSASSRLCPECPCVRMTLRMSTHSDTKNLDVHPPIFLTMCLQRANHAKVISQMLVLALHTNCAFSVVRGAQC